MDGFSSDGGPCCGARPYGSLCDIAANLLDDMFRGVYNGKKKHEEDIDAVLARAASMGVDRIITASGSVEESAQSRDMISGRVEKVDLYYTVGVHPTRSGVFNEETRESVIESLKRLIEEGSATGRVVAVGECGLDYDRIEFCGKELQRIGFAEQLQLASLYDLPLLLHDRNTEGDFLTMIRENIHKLRRGGVVHSCTGSMEEMIAYSELGLCIGVNGCSLKTAENLSVVAAIPLHLILLETDAPWCGIKNTHASKPSVRTDFPTKKNHQYISGYMVKDRCEPCHLINVLEAVAAVRSMDPTELAAQVRQNTDELFFRR